MKFRNDDEEYILNPFAILAKRKSKHVNPLWTDKWWQRTKDTFAIFWGRKESDSYTLGLLDYLLLPAVTRILFGASYTNRNDSILAKRLLIPTFLLFAAMEVVRFIAAAALTIVAMPFILATNTLFSIKNFFLKRSVENIEGRNIFVSSSTPVKLTKFLHDNHTRLSEVTIVCAGTNKTPILHISKTIKDSTTYYGAFMVDLTQTKNRKDFNIMLETNMGGVTDSLIHHDTDFSFFKKKAIMEPSTVHLVGFQPSNS